MSITLPPLPERNPRSYKWTEREKQEIRARDLEVVRVVLKAAAQAAGPEDSYQDRWFAAKADAVKRIRALEVRHHE